MKSVLDRLEECVLPLVSKPNRYLSPFPGGALVGFEAASARLCLVIPEPIERGLSRTAVATAFDALRREASGEGSALLDICFAPAPDLEQELVRHEMPLFGLGARRALGEYDVLVVLPFAALELPDFVTMLRLGAFAALSLLACLCAGTEARAAAPEVISFAIQETHRSLTVPIILVPRGSRERAP